jgi:oligopeptide transport system ATP-binding protein
LVGESGCGKTTAGRCLLQLERPTAGEVLFEGTDLCGLSEEAMRAMRRRMQIIFQDPFGSLNPRMTAGEIIGEPLETHGLAKGKQKQEQVAELLRIVGLNPKMADRFPHEFSGGQRQRIGIAKGLAVHPSFMVCDEPVSALDVSIQAQIINLLEELQSEFHLTYLFIAHDLAVVRHLSDRIAVMYLGNIVEIAPRATIYDHPLHPYTQALLAAVPVPDPVVEAGRRHILLKGEIPSPLHPPSGCKFHPRCFQARFPQCREEVPSSGRQRRPIIGWPATGAENRLKENIDMYKPPASSGIAIMPTNLEFIKNARQALIAQAGGMANLPTVADHTVAGDVWSVAVSFLTDEKQIAAMLPPGKNLSIYGPPVVTVAAVYQGSLNWLAAAATISCSSCSPWPTTAKTAGPSGPFCPWSGKT